MKWVSQSSFLRPIPSVGHCIPLRQFWLISGLDGGDLFLGWRQSSTKWPATTMGGCRSPNWAGGQPSDGHALRRAGDLDPDSFVRQLRNRSLYWSSAKGAPGHH
jgi:hypothetical protein